MGKILETLLHVREIKKSNLKAYSRFIDVVSLCSKKSKINLVRKILKALSDSDIFGQYERRKISKGLKCHVLTFLYSDVNVR